MTPKELRKLRCVVTAQTSTHLYRWAEEMGYEPCNVGRVIDKLVIDKIHYERRKHNAGFRMARPKD